MLSNHFRLSSVHNEGATSVSIQGLGSRNNDLDLKGSRAVKSPVLDLLSYLSQKEMYRLDAPNQLLCPESKHSRFDAFQHVHYHIFTDSFHLWVSYGHAFVGDQLAADHEIRETSLFHPPMDLV